MTVLCLKTWPVPVLGRCHKERGHDGECVFDPVVRMWLDDVRPAPEGWVHVKTCDEAIALLRAGAVEEASLDHDLGHCEACEGCRGVQRDPCPCACHRSGTFLVNWMATENRWPATKPRVHSANPVGAERMRQTIERYWQPPSLAASTRGRGSGS